MPWESSKYYIFSEYICSPIYPVRNARVTLLMELVACPFLLYFFALSQKTDFEKKKFLNIKLYFDFLYNFFQNISHSKKNAERDITINVLTSLQNIRRSYHILMKVGFSR